MWNRIHADFLLPISLDLYSAGARPAKALVMMAGGKPIVVAAAGEVARLVETSGSGIVVPPDEHDSLALAIRTVLQDDAKASEMGKNGRRFVVSNFQLP
jgi:colanic acid biosynthesis glycosyl transferase WcaI